MKAKIMSSPMKLPNLDEDMVIALPADHVLGDQDPLPLSAIAGEELILFPRDIGPGLYDSVLAACHKAPRDGCRECCRAIPSAPGL